MGQMHCPFCGSNNIEDCYVFLKCKDCLAEGPKMNGGKNDSHADWIDHENALKRWNTRMHKPRDK